MTTTYIINVTALRRLKPPPPKRLPPARLGHPHTHYPHPPRVRRRGLLPQRRHDPEQQEEGGQGQGCCWQEEGIDEVGSGGHVSAGVIIWAFL